MDLIEIIKNLGTVAGALGIVELIKFFITRKDKKQERQEDREDQKKSDIQELKKDTEEKLDALQAEFKEGLADREKRSTDRYLEHKEAILNMNQEHRKDFQELLKAIQQLTTNDTKTTEMIETNQQTVGVLADGMVGMIHNTILFTSKGIIDRGVVTFEELATLESLYVPYTKLGGNGDVRKRYEKINELKTVSKEEADRIDAELRKKEFKELQEAVRS